MQNSLTSAIACILAAACPILVWAQGTTADEIARYRAMLADDNPAELWEARGAALWKKKTGPKDVSLEQCDLLRLVFGVAEAGDRQDAAVAVA